MLKHVVTRSRVEGLVILLVAIGYLWEAQNVPAFYQMPGVPGPTTFPRLLGVVFALAGLWLLISPRELIAARRAGPAREEAPASARPGLLRRIGGDWHFYLMWVVVLAYLWVMPDLGFPVATLLVMAAFVFLLGETRWHVVAGLSIVATTVIYVCFKFGLGVRLPLGVLEPLFK